MEVPPTLEQGLFNIDVLTKETRVMRIMNIIR